MTEHGATGDSQDGLAAEARFWREWNTSVFERSRSREQAAEIAAHLSPDPERLAGLLARAQTGSALTQPAPAKRGGDLIQVHADAGRFYQSSLERSWVPGYLAERGLEAVLLPTSPWKVGYAPDSWTVLTAHLRSLGHSDDMLARSGLVTVGKDGHLRGRFRDRLMIPIRRAGDRVVIAFIGRRHPEAGDDHGPKYLNSPNTELYVKGNVLPGLAEGRWFLDHGAQPVLVEGPTDAWAVSIAAPGTYVGIPLCGTAFTAEQAVLLARAVNLRDRGVLLGLDADGPGRKAAVSAYPTLSQVADEVTAVAFAGAKDAAEAFREQGPRKLKDMLMTKVRPLADIVVDTRIDAWAHDGELDSVESQLGAIRAAAKVIATMPPGEAASQASRVAVLFMRCYQWKPEEVTRELVEGVDRYFMDAPPIRAGTTLARDLAEGLPAQTAIVVAQATAPWKAQIHEERGDASQGEEHNRVPARSPARTQGRESERG